jgi:hypothetical protein
MMMMMMMMMGWRTRMSGWVAGLRERRMGTRLVVAEDGIVSRQAGRLFY